MAEIKTSAGTTIHIDAGGISTLVGGPSGTALGGLAEGVTTAEAPDALLARLDLVQDFARLTRPDGSALWVRGSAVSLLRPPLPTETPPGGTGKATLLVGGSHQTVAEDVAAVLAAVNACGGQL
ncbi:MULTISPECIES: hypothetical protein [Nitrospirillum]|uniref:Uncharacterized protein n=1 Tax=Nitrospirillum amazonense TaxID=28077 RepID=A0A560F0F6_9PROT|nr:hypothetical protein [Nitrospirillum amazonense]MEC4594079.1 hypothetical protein [Nitrospirillum amazonense]TWB14975.1 hypothetical protein FBZ88_1329 [Nitrospirillum amazonense]